MFSKSHCRGKNNRIVQRSIFTIWRISNRDFLSPALLTHKLSKILFVYSNCDTKYKKESRVEIPNSLSVILTWEELIAGKVLKPFPISLVGRMIWGVTYQTYNDIHCFIYRHDIQGISFLWFVFCNVSMMFVFVYNNFRE